MRNDEVNRLFWVVRLDLIWGRGCLEHDWTFSGMSCLHDYDFPFLVRKGNYWAVRNHCWFSEIIIKIGPLLCWEWLSETTLTLRYTQIDCTIIIGWNIFMSECKCLSIRWAQIRMYNDTHKIIEFIGNLITSDNITLLDTFLNGTQKLGVFFFLKCDPRIVSDREVRNKWNFFDCVKLCSHL